MRVSTTITVGDLQPLTIDTQTLLQTVRATVQSNVSAPTGGAGGGGSGGSGGGSPAYTILVNVTDISVLSQLHLLDIKELDVYSQVRLICSSWSKRDKVAIILLL